MQRTSLVPMVAASALLAMALCACNRQPSPAAATQAPAAAASTARATVAAAQPAGTPSYTGYGPLKFGMNSKEMREAWKSPLPGATPANLGDCYQLAVDPSAPKALSLMVEGDKLVRYDVSSDTVAPGGGKVGMGIDQIRKLYAGRIREQPDKYVHGGVDLRVSADDDSGSALVFQTDAAGTVTAWRVGQPPAVDYVEGCS